MKHDSQHRAALYYNPILTDNISSSVQLTGNAGHEPVHVLKVPVLPYPQVTALDSPGALGTFGAAKYDLAFNFAQVILFDATGGKEYPRGPDATWQQRLEYLYNVYGDVSAFQVLLVSFGEVFSLLPFCSALQIPSMRTKKVVPGLFEGQQLNAATEALDPLLSGMGAAEGEWSVRRLVAERASRLHAPVHGPAVMTQPGASPTVAWLPHIFGAVPATAVPPTTPFDIPAHATETTATTAALAAPEPPVAALFDWSPQRFFGKMRDIVTTAFSHAASLGSGRPLFLQDAGVASPDTVQVASTVLPMVPTQPLTAMSSLVLEPDLDVSYNSSREAKVFVANVAKRFAGQKNLDIPGRLDWSDRFLLFYGAYVPPGLGHPMPPLWLSAKRYGNVGEIWSEFYL